MAQLVKHAVHLRLLDSQGVLQGLNMISIPHHQFSEGIVERSAHLLRHFLLVIEELLVVFQGHLIEMRLLLHPVQLKLS